jgi:hypothetical protein
MMPTHYDGSALLLKLQSLIASIKIYENSGSMQYSNREYVRNLYYNAREQEDNRLRASISPVYRLPPELLGSFHARHIG